MSEMTHEIREKLLSRLPFSNSATIEYTPEMFEDDDDVPVEFKPVFTIRALTRKEQSDLIRVVSKMKADNYDDSQLREIIRKTVKGWRNLWDLGSKTEILYEADADGAASKALWDQMPTVLINDLFAYVSKISGTRKAEEKGL